MPKKNRGLTLIELIITLALIGLVLQVVYSLLFTGNNSFVLNTNKGFTQQEARLLGDIINSELRNITNMTTDPTVVEEHFIGNYYSLEFTTEDGLPVLLRKFYEYDGEDYNVSEKLMPGTSAPYKEFRISNKEEGIINILIEHEMTKGKLTTGYKLPFNIHLVNNIGLVSGVEVDLMDEGAVLYYTKAQDMLLGKQIDIPEVPTGEDEEETPEPTESPEPTTSPSPTESPEPTSTPEPTPIPVTVHVKAGNVIKIDNGAPQIDSGSGRYKIKKANKGSSLIQIQLNDYIKDMHDDGKVKVTISSASNGKIQDLKIEELTWVVVSFKLQATSNGSGVEVTVNLKIETTMWDGTTKVDEKPYNFIAVLN